MTPEQQTADLRCVQEFEAVEAAFARGAEPETYRVQVQRVLDNAAQLPPSRCKHWLKELERVGEVVPKPEPVKVAKPTGGESDP